MCSRQKLYGKKINFRFPGLLIYYLISSFCHNFYDMMHILMGIMTMYGK